MARTQIETGSAANDGTGDPLRTAFIATEDNFIDLYDQFDNVPSFPFTSSTDNPTQITGSNGTEAILGVTGSIEASRSVTSSFFQISKAITFKDNPNTKIEFADNGVINFLVDNKNFLKIDGDNSRITVNPDGIDINFEAHGDANDNLLFCDAGSDRVGILTNSPQTDFHVNGTVSASRYFGNIPEGQTAGLEAGQFYYTSSEYFTGGAGPHFDVIIVKD